MINEFKAKVDENGFFQHNRLEQNKFWLFQTINDYLKNRFYEDPKIKTALKEQLDLIENNKTTAFAAAKHLLSLA